MSIRTNLIIPCYNPPEADWASNIIQEFRKLQSLLPDFELNIIVVNDGSSRGISDTDFNLIRSQIAGSQVISYAQNQGKGHALREGIRISDAEYHVFTDVDFPYELFSVSAVIKTIAERKGIAAGHRNQAYYTKVPLFRKWLSIAFRAFIRLVGVPVSDTQCGLKGFDNQGREIFLKTETNRYLFDFEFLILAARQKNIPIYPITVQLKEGVTFTTMGWKVLKTEFFNLIKILLR